MLTGSQAHVIRDHFLARFRDILAFFCKKSHQNSRSEKKNRTLIFSHFAPLSSYFAFAVHFETIGLFCLTGFWIIVAPKFITHMTAGNLSLICITGKLYRKKSLSVSKVSCSSTTQLNWSGHALLPWFGWRSNTRPSWAWWITSTWSPYSAVCILIRGRRNEKEMKVKPATSFKII